MPVVALLDTNVWVSALLNPAGAPARLIRAWLDGRYQIVISLPLLDELADVLTRPRISRRYSLAPAEVEEYLKLLGSYSRIVVPSGSLHECRDPDDDIVLETAVLGNAQYAVTRDDDIKRDLDLIAHLHAHGVTVSSVQQFLDLLESIEPGI